MAFKSLKALFSDVKDLSSLNDKIDEALAGEEVIEEEPEEEPEEPEPEPEEEPEEESEEEEEEEEEEPEEEDLDAEPDFASAMAMLTAKIEELAAEVESLKHERDTALEELSAKKASEKAFMEKLPKLFTSLSTEKPENAPEAPVFTNGIGEL